LDQRGVLGVTERGEAKQRVDRRQSGVARADRVVALVLEMLEERGDQRRVEIVEVKPRRLFARSLLGEGQQQSQRVAVGGDRMRAGAALVREAVGEERLCGRPHRRSYPNPQTMWTWAQDAW